MLEVNKNNFEKEVIKSNLPAVVDFWAGWCGPCKVLAPTFEKISKEFAGKMVFAKCNVDENQDIAQNNSIMSLPCIVVFKNGSETGRIIGNQSEEMLRQQLKVLM